MPRAGAPLQQVQRHVLQGRSPAQRGVAERHADGAALLTASLFIPGPAFFFRIPADAAAGAEAGRRGL